MAESKPKALVVDFNNLWNKYLYSRGGNFTNAIYATLYFFRDLYNSREFQRVYIVLDGKPDKGYEIYKDYKANRKSDPHKYIPLKVVMSVLSQYFNVVGGKKNEGDEVTAYIATRLLKNYDTYIYSNDKDFIQLMNLGVKIVKEFKQGRITELLTEEGALNKFKNTQGTPLKGLEYILIYRIFKGDYSDGIPSACTGMFDKIIRQMIYTHWDYPEVTEENIEEFISRVNQDTKIGKRISSDYKENLKRNWKLMDLCHTSDELKTQVKKIHYSLDEEGLSKYNVCNKQLFYW